MNKKPICEFSLEERKRRVEYLAIIRDQTATMDRAIESHHRRLYYYSGYEITDAHILAATDHALNLLHVRMQQFENISTTLEQQVDARGFVWSPTQWKCSVCNNAIYYQYSLCEVGKHIVCPPCRSERRFRQCYRCLEADTTFNPTYDKN